MGFFTLETAQAQLAPGGDFGPWIWALKLKAEHVSVEEVRLRLPYSDHVARPGGVVIGQAMMAMADTVMVLAICERLGRFATLAANAAHSLSMIQRARRSSNGPIAACTGVPDSPLSRGPST